MKKKKKRPAHETRVLIPFLWRRVLNTAAENDDDDDDDCHCLSTLSQRHTSDRALGSAKQLASHHHERRISISRFFSVSTNCRHGMWLTSRSTSPRPKFLTNLYSYLQLVNIILLPITTVKNKPQKTCHARAEGDSRNDSVTVSNLLPVSPTYELLVPSN